MTKHKNKTCLNCPKQKNSLLFTTAYFSLNIALLKKVSYYDRDKKIICTNAQYFYFKYKVLVP